MGVPPRPILIEKSIEVPHRTLPRMSCRNYPSLGNLERASANGGGVETAAEREPRVRHGRCDSQTVMAGHVPLQSRWSRTRRAGRLTPG
jgi:hypothetical protein